MSAHSLNSGFGVTADDIRACDWQASVAEAKPREWHAYAENPAKKATSLEAAGDGNGPTKEAARGVYAASASAGPQDWRLPT